MINKFFTAFDGTTYIAKAYLKNLIKTTMKERPFKNQFQCNALTEKLLTEIDACQYTEQIPELTNPDVDYFYCGGCRRGFPVRYTNEMVKIESRPCPMCGASAYVTPKLDKEEETNEKDNPEST